MNNTNVISINPSKKTTGQINTEFWAKMARKCRVRELDYKLIRFKSVLNIFTGINKNVSETTSKKLLITRVVIASLVIFYAITTLYSIPMINTYIYFTTAVLLLLGCAQRLLMTALSVALLITGLFPEGIIAGMLAFFGPGIYSIDQLLRRSIFRTYKKSVFKRARLKELNLQKLRMTYKAFQVLQ